MNPMALITFLFCLGLALVMVGAWVYAPLYDLPAGLDWTEATLVFLGLLALCGVLLRAREKEWKRWWLLLAASCFFLAPTALALVVGVRLTLNGWLDRSEPTHHTARVLEVGTVRSTTGPGPHYYRLEVASWRPGDPDPWIVVNPRLYTEVTPGESEVGVVTKPGWLGIEWIVEAHLELPEDRPGPTGAAAPWGTRRPTRVALGM